MTFTKLRVAVGWKRWSERLILAAGLGSLLACSLSGCAPEGFDPNDPDGVLGTTSQELTGFDPLPQGLDWEVLPRFPVDTDGDGVREERVDEVYVLPEAHGGYPSILKGCPSGDSAAYTYRWTVEGAPLATTDCNAHHAFPRQGGFAVELNVTSRATGASAVYRRQVQVKDWFIVAVGDSYGSGEGNPDVPRYLDQPARWADRRCHRTFKAGAAVAARMLEEEDPHSSVTFFSLACSGANISLDSYGDGDVFMGSGLLGSYRGIETAEGPIEFLPAQVDQLHTLARSRKIDAILVSGGGNDMEFGKLGKECVLDPGCHNNGGLKDLLASRRAELPGRYDALNQRLREYFPSTEVYLTEYPDPTTGLHGETCERILDDVFPILTTTPFEVNRDEGNFLRSNLLTPLNQMGKAKAQELGWNYVGGIAQAFSGYGYCSPVRKFRKSWESVTLQGPDDRTKTKGTLHPNEDGHWSYARQLADALRRTQKMGSGSPLFGPTVYSTEAMDWGYDAGRTWADVDGDGRADYCRFIGDSGTMRIQCTLSIEDGFGATLTSQVLDPGWPAGRAFVDANGDRRADYCRVVGDAFRGDSAVACTLNLGTATESTIISARGLDWGYDDGRTWADVDADGRADYCRLVGNSNFVDSRIACTPSTGNGFGSTWFSPVLDWGYGGTRMWSDVDSDGRVDFCRYSGDLAQPTLQCSRSTGTSFGPTYSTRLGGPGGTEGRAWVSINGDAHKDFCRVVGWDGVGVQCVLGASGGFGQAVTSGDLELGAAHSRTWVDVSGDGNADFCREVGTGNETRIRCALGGGSSGFGHEVESGRLDPGHLSGRAWVDVTRDGRADYCRVGGTRFISQGWVMCSSVSYRGPVQEKYLAAGGASGLGVATTGELFYAGGQYQHFERGAVYWNYSRGTFVVRDAIWDKWRQKGLESGVLGAPVSDAIQSTDGSGWLQHFEHGTILLHPVMGAREVHGAIRDRYSQLGWERGVLGYPKTDERTSWTNRGTYVHFEGGSLFSTAGGIFSVQGALRDRYSALSFEQGPMGFPVAEQQCSYSSCVQRFETGALYQRGGGTTHAIHGWVYGAYRNQGEHTGRLGYPEGSVSVSSSSQTATFEEGLISCSSANSCQVIRFGP